MKIHLDRDSALLMGWQLLAMALLTYSIHAQDYIVELIGIVMLSVQFYKNNL